MKQQLILILEPDVVVRRILVGMLKAAGYQVIPLGSVADACKALMQYCVDLVLVDGAILTPETTHFMTELRSCFPGTARVLLVDHHYQASGLEALDAGLAQALISKLVGSVKLLETVSRVMEHTAERNAVSEQRAAADEHVGRISGAGGNADR